MSTTSAKDSSAGIKSPGRGSTTSKKGKKGVKTKKISLVSVEEDPKYISLLEENTQLEMNNNMLKQELESLMKENEESQRRVKDLELDLKFNAFQL